MKINTSWIIFSLFGAVLMFSCEKEDEYENESKISYYNGTESHNMGQNCMNCHKQGGQGEGWFTAAGTVYDSALANVYPNATVKLYTGPNGSGQLKYTLEVDALGNFYTTNAIEFTGGLYPAVSGATSTRFMSAAITSGPCNSCHGNSTNKIWTK